MMIVHHVEKAAVIGRSVPARKTEIVVRPVPRVTGRSVHAQKVEIGGRRVLQVTEGIVLSGLVVTMIVLPVEKAAVIDPSVRAPKVGSGDHRVPQVTVLSVRALTMTVLARHRVPATVSNPEPGSAASDRPLGLRLVIAARRARTAATTVRARTGRRAETSGRTANRVARESFILRSDSYRES